MEEEYGMFANAQEEEAEAVVDEAKKVKRGCGMSRRL